MKRKDALRHFKASVRNEKDWTSINTALNNYLVHVAGKDPQYIQVGSTWFNNWEDWVNNPIVDKRALAESAKHSAQVSKALKEFENVK